MRAADADLGIEPRAAARGRRVVRLRMEPLLLDSRDAAAVLAISEDTLQRLRSAGWLDSLRIGQRVVYHVDELRAFAQRLRQLKQVGYGESPPGSQRSVDRAARP